MLEVITIFFRKIFKIRADFVTGGGYGVRNKCSLKKNRGSFVLVLNILLKSILYWSASSLPLSG